MSITAKEKYGFTDQETIALIVATKDGVLNLEKVAQRPADRFSKFIRKNREELSAILGIQDSIWAAAENQTYTAETEQKLNDIRYRQVGKFVIMKVIVHILVECVSFKQDPSIALTKIKLAVNLFEPLPDFQGDGEVDKDKYLADQITDKEVRRIEELLDVRDLSGRSSQ